MSAKVNFSSGSIAPVRTVGDDLAKLGNTTMEYQKMQNDQNSTDARLAMDYSRLAMADKQHADALAQQDRLYQRQLDRDQKADAQQLIANELARKVDERQTKDQNWQDKERTLAEDKRLNDERLAANYDSVVYGGLQKADDIITNTRMLELTTGVNEALEKESATDPIYVGISKQIQQADQAVRTAVGKDSAFRDLKDEDISRLAVVGNGKATDNLGSVTIGEGDKARTFTSQDRLRLGAVVEEARSAAAPDLFGGKEDLGRFMSSTKAGLTTDKVTLDEYKNATRLAATMALEEQGIKPTEENRAKVEALILKEKANAGFRTAAEMIAAKDKKIEEERKGLDSALDVVRTLRGQAKNGQSLDGNGNPTISLSKLDQALSPKAYGTDLMRELKISNSNGGSFYDSDVENMNQRLAGLYADLEDKQSKGVLDPRAAALTIQDAINKLNTSGSGLGWSDLQFGDKGSKSSATSTEGIKETGITDYARYEKMLKSGNFGNDRRLLLADAETKVSNAQAQLEQLKAAEAVPRFDTKAVTKEYFRLPK